MRREKAMKAANLIADEFTLGFCDHRMVELFADRIEEVYANEENLRDDEMITYEVLLKDLRDAKNVDRGYHLDKIERFVAIMNIRANKALPEGWRTT